MQKLQSLTANLEQICNVFCQNSFTSHKEILQLLKNDLTNSAAAKDHPPLNIIKTARGCLATSINYTHTN